jgi:hypothetical protein
VLAVVDCLTKRNLVQIRYLMALISVYNPWKYEYGSDLATSPMGTLVLGYYLFIYLFYDGLIIRPKESYQVS